MKKHLLKVATLLALATFNFGYSWGLTGHRVIAQIAENHLDNKARRHLKKIFGTEKLAYWANWPDFIKSDTTGVYKGTERWHYVDVQPGSNLQEFTENLKAKEGPNLYTQIQALSAQIKDEKTSDKDREIALRFLIHLVGDMSQPLHVGHEEDLGGNKIRIKFFNEGTNLHSLWDTKLIDSQKYSYTEFAELLDVKPEDEVRNIQSGTLEDWLYDSAQQATRIYNETPADNNYSYDYE